jgi:beta-lactam-binding protein with PASTA domain
VRVGIVPDVVGLEREAALALLRGPSGDLFRNVVVREQVDASRTRGTVVGQEPMVTGILIPFTTQVILTVAIPAAPAGPVRRPTTR